MRFVLGFGAALALFSLASSASAQTPPGEGANGQQPVAQPTATPAPSAKSGSEPTDKDVDLAVQGTIGFIPTRVTGTAYSGGATGVSNGGDGKVNTTGFPLRVAVTMAFPYFGDGIPRAFAYAGVGYVFLHKGTATYGAFNGAAADTGATVDRQWQLDFGLGGLFPMCRQFSCADLRIIVGATFIHENLTGFTTGGSDEKSGWKSGLMISPTLAIPICGDKCTRTSLRFLVGAVGRAFAGSSVYFGNVGVGVDPHLEFEAFVGLSATFAEF